MIPTTAPTISSRTITSTTAIPPATEPRSLEDPLCSAVPTPGSLVVVVLSVVEGSEGSEGSDEGGGVDTGLELVEVVVETVDMSSTLVELSVVLPVVYTLSGIE